MKYFLHHLNNVLKQVASKAHGDVAPSQGVYHCASLKSHKSSRYGFLMRGVYLPLVLVACPLATPPVTNSPSVPETALSTPAVADVQSALQEAIADYTRQQGAPPNASIQFFADTTDLNDDGVLDAVVILSTSYWCGTGGCSMLILQGQPDNTFRLVSVSSLVRPPLTVSETRTNGWRDLILTVSGGGMPGKAVALRFDGQRYPLNPSVQPELPANTPVNGTVLFPEGTQPQTLSSATTAGDLLTYNEPEMAIATQYPSNMTVDASCSGEGCGYFFKFLPQNNAMDEAEVHIFLPAGATTAAQAEIGLNDMIQSNGWIVADQATPTQEWQYPWVKKVVTFSADREMAGHILMGETNGQGVRVTLLYPTEMSGSFVPAAKTILDNLQFKPEQLPI
jgi:hypothetical protein